MKISAGSSRIGGPLCLYDEEGNPIALMSDKLANKERVALDIVAAVNGRDWRPISTAPNEGCFLVYGPGGFGDDCEKADPPGYWSPWVQVAHATKGGGFCVPFCLGRETLWAPISWPQPATTGTATG